MNKKPKLYILIGPPSSGKTSLAASINGTSVCGETADSRVMADMKKILSEGTNAILDLDAVSKEQRLAIYKACPEGTKKTVMVFITSLNECLERNAKKDEPLSREEVVKRYIEFEEDCASIREEGADRLFFVAN